MYYSGTWSLRVLFFTVSVAFEGLLQELLEGFRALYGCAQGIYKNFGFGVRVLESPRLGFGALVFFCRC